MGSTWVVVVVVVVGTVDVEDEVGVIVTDVVVVVVVVVVEVEVDVVVVVVPTVVVVVVVVVLVVTTWPLHRQLSSFRQPRHASFAVRRTTRPHWLRTSRLKVDQILPARLVALHRALVQGPDDRRGHFPGSCRPVPPAWLWHTWYRGLSRCEAAVRESMRLAALRTKGSRQCRREPPSRSTRDTGHPDCTAPPSQGNASTATTATSAATWPSLSIPLEAYLQPGRGSTFGMLQGTASRSAARRGTNPPITSAIARPAAIVVRSSRYGPTICTPTGSPPACDRPALPWRAAAPWSRARSSRTGRCRAGCRRSSGSSGR